MKLKIAGGCGEHGRNCFYVETADTVFLVDCGVMAGEDGGGYPHLTVEEIRKCQYIFLTHSHADHTAAVPWLIKNGFQGKVIASEHTLKQLPFEVACGLSLESFCESKTGKIGDLLVTYGYSGHCLGSVWYEFEIGSKKILFSGDYTEDTFVHRQDTIRNHCTDMAVVDCAYGYDRTSFEVYCEQLLKGLKNLKKNYPVLLMTVPKYGRGLELFYLLRTNFPDWKYTGDEHFVSQCKEISKNSSWFKGKAEIGNLEVFDENTEADVVFVSDPQLRSEKAGKIALEVLKTGYAIMTGTVEEGTLSAQLMKENKMKMYRFPVHLNYEQYQKVMSGNEFQKMIPYHSPELKTKEIYEI